MLLFLLLLRLVVLLLLVVVGDATPVEAGAAIIDDLKRWEWIARKQVTLKSPEMERPLMGLPDGYCRPIVSWGAAVPPP